MAVKQALLGLVLAKLCVGVVVGAPAAMQPSSSDDSEVGCARPLVDVVWGFLLTLLALVIALWTSAQQNVGSKSEKMLSLVVAIAAPILHLVMVHEKSYTFIVMVWYCHKMKYERMSFEHLCSLLNPLSRSPLRILNSCEIIMYFKKRVSSLEEENGNYQKLREAWIWGGEMYVEDESEGLIVGEDGARETKSMQYERNQLSQEGKLALIWGEYFDSECEYKFLPKYNEMKFLRGNSGFAVIAIVFQAIGYIYAVIFRSVEDMRVSPIEVIGLIFNIILLINASLYSVSNMCVRPLIIYMNKEREMKFVNILQSRPRSFFSINGNQIGKLSYCSVAIIVLFICIPILVYFTISLKKATSLMVVAPLIIFGVSLLLNLLFTLKYLGLIVSSTIPRTSFSIIFCIKYSWLYVGVNSDFTLLEFSTLRYSFQIVGPFTNVSFHWLEMTKSLISCVLCNCSVSQLYW